jgi:hypothetical protein
MSLLPATVAARFDVLEVSNHLAYASGSMGTHLLPLASGRDRGYLFSWVIIVGVDGLGQ